MRTNNTELSDAHTIKPADLMLSGSEAKYRTLFETMNEGFAVCELIRNETGKAISFTLREVNAALLRLTGLTAEILGKHVEEIMPDLDVSWWLTVFTNVVDAKKQVRFDREVKPLGRWFRISAALYEADQFTVICDDITELKNGETIDIDGQRRATEALQRSEEQFRLFVDASSDTLYKMSADWQHMLNLEGKNFLQDTTDPSVTWLDRYIPAEDQPAIKQVIRQAIDAKTIFELEHRVIGADGSIRWVFSKAVPMLDKQGNIIEWLGAANDITLRKHAEQELKTLNESLEQLVEKRTAELKEQANFISSVSDTMPDVVTVVEHPSRNLQYSNRDAMTLLGFDADEMIRIGHEDRTQRLHPDDVSGLMEYYKRFDTLKDGEKNFVEYRIMSKNNEWMWLSVRGQVFRRDAEGNVTHTLNIGQDITERKKAELELKESKDLLQTVFDSSLNIITVMKAVRDEQGRIINFRFVLSNTSPQGKHDDRIGRLYTEVQPDVKKTMVYQRFVELVESGGTVDYEICYQRDGVDTWLHVMGVKLGDGFISSSQDITARKQAEAQLKEQLHFINQVAVTIPDMLTVMWLDTHDILFANTRPFMENGFNYERISNMNVPQRAEIIHPDDIGALRNYFQNFKSYPDDKIQSLEYRAKNDDGKWLWFRVRGKVFKRDNTGRPIQCVNLVQNVNGLKMAEQQLINLKLRQQKEILNTIVLTQEQERQRIGEDLHDGVAQLLYGIQTRLQLLKITEPKDQENLKEILSIINATINDTRRISFELVPVVLKDFGVVMALEALFQRIVYPGLHVRFYHQGFGRLPEKTEFAVYRIVQELVNNIIKHAHATEAVVDIRENEHHLVLSVSDNGSGFNQKETKRLHKGIGLQSIKNRVQLFEGEFKIISAAGKGTQIIISFPKDW